ncbi:Protein of unknown function DUF4406 [uncultured Caudovirales phage]|uniref:dATP/dGTP diphosphohydrolase N-terminal domain-containing protein n=1 Tax=uncultured Caudovirales phage TaxID=2100421 RepID=A0A6J5LQ71_9CAUD|nr:Protein of unknown function DUF4406 [uncultured Caudovirales phage]CAB4150833.1 Protein of unknown function DUF4406 [uncultured Caudovirales phage]CAB4199575.1 Protein of unknown function DUF4406 [uncultured Caudovirales phage]
MRSIYIAGPMTGYAKFNFPAFDAARDYLERDWNVISPADMDRELGFDAAVDEVTAEFLRDAMRRDINAIMAVDAVYALAGWEQSKGASAEVALAEWRGIPVYYEKVPELVGDPAGNDPKGEIGKTKAPMWLLPPVALRAISWVHGLGSVKYGPWNWRKTKVCASTYISAIHRHLAAWHEGQDTDDESGQSHLAHIGACCNILMDAQHHNRLDDDRP